MIDHLDISPPNAFPQVSCIMAVHRDIPALWKSLASILAQTGVTFEVIVVANRCSNEFWQKLTATTDPRVRLFRTEIGQLCFNLNYALNEARANLIARMDDDDLCEPGRFFTQWQAFQDDPSLDVLGTGYIEIDEAGRELGTYTPPLSNQAIRARLPVESVLAHPTVMFKKATVMNVGGYAYGHFAEDYDLWLRLRRNPRITFGNLSQPLLRYRRHSGQMTHSSTLKGSASDVLGLFVREFFRTGDFKFLLGFLRKMTLSTSLWRQTKWLRRRLGLGR